MILKALYDYYQRKSRLGEIPPLGFEDKAIPFLAVIDDDGKLLALEDTTSKTEKKGRIFRLPKAEGRSGKNAYMFPNLLWDHIGFVFGYPKSDSPKDTGAAKNQSKAFADKIVKLSEMYPENREFLAVRRFVENPNRLEEAQNMQEWAQCVKIAGCNITFRLRGETEIVAANPDVADFLGKSINAAGDDKKYVCLITGEKTVPVMTHGGFSIGGSAGVKLVSFQTSSGYDSYYKEQGENAPVSLYAELAYTSALSTLLSSKSNQLGIGGLKMVFWSDSEKSEIENVFGSLFGIPAKDNPDGWVSSISALYKSVFSGREQILEDRKFFVLGLAANKTRMIVRFFVADTERAIGARIAQHFSDFDMVRKPSERQLFSVFNILSCISPENKIEKIPPNIEGALISAVLSGGMYPRTLQLQCLNRIRADRVINRIRAAILKAYLNRKNRILNNSEREIKVSLDIENNNTGYLCGRLFAVLERIQETALGKQINATIVDRFYGAASSTPMSVFGHLIGLSNHHLSKIENQAAVVFLKKTIGEIMDKMPASGFPSHLSLDGQSRFAIGYYQQRQDFFNSKEENMEK